MLSIVHFHIYWIPQTWAPHIRNSNNDERILIKNNFLRTRPYKVSTRKRQCNLLEDYVKNSTEIKDWNTIIINCTAILDV